MSKFIESIQRVVDGLSGREVHALNVALTVEAQDTLRELIQRPNPRLSEAPFLGIGTSELITEIVTIPDGFSERSGLLMIVSLE